MKTPAPPPDIEPTHGLFGSLSHRNYRLFILGQGVSLTGTWVQQVAMSWLVYRLTNDPFWLGAIGFCGQIPTFFLAPLVGVWSDRWNRHRVIIAAQFLAMVQAAVAAWLVWTGAVAVWQLVLLAVWLGCVNAFEIPTRMAFLSEMLENRADLANAIAVNSSLVNLARLAGPALAGALINWVGEAACFALNAVSYLAVLAGLLAMRLRPRSPPAIRKQILVELIDGLRYAYGHPGIRAVLVALMCLSLFGAPYTVLLPFVAREVLGGGPETYGFLVSAAGLGALFAALTMAARSHSGGLESRILLGSALLAVGLAGLSQVQSLPAALALLFLSGFAVMMQLTASNTLLQETVEEDKRGRVMSLYSMSFMGTIPLGSLLAGEAAACWGPAVTFELGGLLSVFAALGYAASHWTRRRRAESSVDSTEPWKGLP